MLGGMIGAYVPYQMSGLITGFPMGFPLGPSFRFSLGPSVPRRVRLSWELRSTEIHGR
ncbi:hypothetical protein RvY_06241 [Ramazzottius varieornatus]|uniref:Uncharacterized protein n=1 Tax=Ramazzottius varieornatus TaxID=947166 RepID=A0A1D1V0V1_RAMVA|nr:hypothetical protein RvY_06241 [Ramazzottius varieornatus]